MQSRVLGRLNERLRGIKLNTSATVPFFPDDCCTIIGIVTYLCIINPSVVSKSGLIAIIA
jgi:hypothetical protein